MPRTLFALFLIAHGLIYGAIYATPRDSAKPAPFDPGHSRALAAVHVADHPARSASIALACTAGLAFALAGVVLLVGGSWWAPIAATAGIAGLLLKGLWFHPWLAVGVLLDLAVTVAALTGPPALS